MIFVEFLTFVSFMSFIVKFNTYLGMSTVNIVLVYLYKSSVPLYTIIKSCIPGSNGTLISTVPFSLTVPLPIGSSSSLYKINTVPSGIGLPSSSVTLTSIVVLPAFAFVTLASMNTSNFSTLNVT